MGILAKAFGLQTLEAAVDGPVGDYSADVTPPSRPVEAFGVDRALTLPAVFRSIQLIQGHGSNLVRNGLGAWRGDTLVEPAPALVRQPDPWRSLRSFAARFMTNAATDGNNFLLKTRVDGVVSSVELLDPFLTRAVWVKGTKFYDTVRRLPNGTLKSIRVPATDVDHIWCGLEVAGHDRALGPIEACRYALTGHLDSRDYAAGWFRDTDVPSGVLSTDQRLDRGAALGYKADWVNPKDENGEPLSEVGPRVRVLGQGLTYSPIMLKPADAQWLESQNFGVVDVARMFGIPASKLLAALEGTSLTYTTVQMVDQEFVRDTLFPVYLAPFEDAISDLLVRGQDARVNLDALLRPDPKTQADIDKTYLDTGVIAPQEIRTRQQWQGPPPEKPTPAPAPSSQEVPA